MNRDAFSPDRHRAKPVEKTEIRMNHLVPTVLGLSPLSRSPVRDEERHRRGPAQDKAFQRPRGSVLTAVVCLFLFILVIAGLSIAAAAKYPEELWQELEKLSQRDREKKLIEGAKNEGETIWSKSSRLESSTRYIQAF